MPLDSRPPNAPGSPAARGAPAARCQRWPRWTASTRYDACTDLDLEIYCQRDPAFLTAARLTCMRLDAECCVQHAATRSHHHHHDHHPSTAACLSPTRDAWRACTPHAAHAARSSTAVHTDPDLHGRSSAGDQPAAASYRSAGQLSEQLSGATILDHLCAEIIELAETTTHNNEKSHNIPRAALRPSVARRS